MCGVGLVVLETTSWVSLTFCVIAKLYYPVVTFRVKRHRSAVLPRVLVAYSRINLSFMKRVHCLAHLFYSLSSAGCVREVVLSIDVMSCT